MHFSFSRPAVRCLILIAALLCLNACFRFTKLDGGPETLPATNPTETDPPETEPPETEPPETKVTAVSSGKPGGKTDFGQGKTPDPEPEPEPLPDPEPVPAPEPFSATLGQIREKNGISTLLASHRTVTVRLSRDFTGESYTQSFRMYDGRIAYLHLSEHAEEDPGTGETSVSRSLSGYYCNANFQEYPGIDGFYVKINIPLAFSNDREVYFERELTDWLDIGEVQSSELIEETDTAATLVVSAEEEIATTVLKLTVVKDTLDLLMIDYHSEENGFVYADTMTVSYDEELPEWAVFEAYEGSRPLRLECSAPDNLQPIEYRIPVDWTLSVDSSYSSWLLGEAPGDNGVDLLEYGPGQHIPETIYTWDSEVLSIDAPPAPEIDFTLEDLKAANNIRSLLAWNESVTARRTLRDAEEILSFWTKDGERVSYDLYIPADGSQSIAGSYNDFTFYIYNGMSLPYTAQKWITAQGGRSDGMDR